MMYVFVTLAALLTTLVDRRELAQNKRLAVAYIALYALALGIAFITMANRDTPGPIQLMDYLLDPLAELLFRME
jgi:ABC-type Mn2+/Zn2+ transport system permease subunit